MYCSTDDYIFNQNGGDLGSVAEKLIAHIGQHHSADFEEVEEEVEPVTNDEIAVLFGLQSEHWSPDHPDEKPVPNPEEGS